MFQILKHIIILKKNILATTINPRLLMLKTIRITGRIK